jgi:hypothetical protein
MRRATATRTSDRDPRTQQPFAVEPLECGVDRVDGLDEHGLLNVGFEVRMTH